MPNHLSPETCPKGDACDVGCKLICSRIAAAERHLVALSKQIRMLQFIVIGGMILDFFMNSGHKAVAALLGR